MNDWILDYWKASDKEVSTVKKIVSGLIKDKIRRQQLTKLVMRVEEFGPQMSSNTKGSKNLGRGLYELRDTSRHTRYYYCETGYCYKIGDKEFKSVLLLLVADGDKDKQQDAIELARGRIKDLNVANFLNENQFEIIKE